MYIVCKHEFLKTNLLVGSVLDGSKLKAMIRYRRFLYWKRITFDPF